MVTDIRRGTGGAPMPMSQMRLELEALCRRGMETAATPETIARHEASVREASEREARERYSSAALEARRLIPVPRAHQDAVIRHCRPGRKEPALERTEALVVTARWHQSESAGRTVLALLGDMGTGKTTAAMVAALRALQIGETVAYVKEPTLLRWRRYVSQTSQLERAMSVGLLIVDELGTAETRDAEQARAAVLEVVDDRLSVGRTMLIGNLSRQAFGSRYDARLADRMREVGIIAECRGASMRGRAA